MNVKELKELLNNLDENLEIFSKEDHMEQGRILVKPFIMQSGFISSKKHFMDAFDGGSYSKVICEESYGSGQKCYVIG